MLIHKYTVQALVGDSLGGRLNFHRYTEILFISIKVTYWHRWTFWAPAFLAGYDVTCMSDRRRGLLLRQPYKVQVQANTPRGTYHKRDLLKYSFYTWDKTSNAATRPTVHRKPIFYPIKQALLLDKFYWRQIVCYSKIFDYSFNFYS